MYKVSISGKLVEPLVEGGKGVAISNGYTCGAWAACGGAGTLSGTVPDSYDEANQIIRLKFEGQTRDERHKELIQQTIRGCIEQIKIAHEIANGNGAIQMNVLWEVGGIAESLHGALQEAGHLLDGVVCGAGLPFALSEIASKYGVYYNPIVSSSLAFAVLWKRSYSKHPDLLGSVIYEDPWVAGGHNGISSREDPTKPESPMERILSLRKFMNNVGLRNTTIVIAGGVWTLSEWTQYINNPDLQPLAFQFGTRPLLTQESPISDEWKQRLVTLPDNIVKLHRFSPTGFYSSSVRNSFLQDLIDRSERQIKYSDSKTEVFNTEIPFGRRHVFIESNDLDKVKKWQSNGYSDLMKTPDSTLIFVTPASRQQILTDQQNCMGCLSKCKFSNWDDKHGSTGIAPDPRSFCILKTLDDIAHGGSIENNLMFAGQNVGRFKKDPFYENGFIPTVAQLYQRIKEEVQG